MDTAAARQADTAMHTHLRQAAAECGGFCAAAALSALGKAFGVPLEEAAVSCGLGVYLPGGEGEAHTAYVGASQFFALAAQAQGLARAEVLQVCRAWRQAFARFCAGPQQAPAAAAPAPAPGERFLDVLLLAQAFAGQRRALLGLDGRAAKPKKYYDSIYEDRAAMFAHSPYALEEKLTKAVMRGACEPALQVLREITAQGEKSVLAKDPMRSAKNSMIGSIAFLSRAAIQAGVSTDDAFSLSDALTRQVEEMTSKRAVLAFEERILLQFIALVRQRLDTAYSAPVMRAVHYIENRLDRKLSLQDAARYAGVHAAYLSARFKRETGAAFSAYAATRKIQESSYFVRHTAYSVSQIATLYGFSSQSYYITTFKKVMGMTPMEYRRRFLAE